MYAGVFVSMLAASLGFVALAHASEPADSADAPTVEVQAKPVTPADYKADLNGTTWTKPGEGFFWYQDPVEKKKKKDLKRTKPKPSVAKKKDDDIYIRPEFRDIPFQPGTPPKLKALMGDPTVENAKEWLKYQAKVINRAAMVGNAIRQASLKYGDEIYPVAGPTNSNSSRAEAHMKQRRLRYARKMLGEKGVLMIFQDDPFECIDCAVMGDYANQYQAQGINVVAVMREGARPHPRATYPYIIDEGGKLAKKFDVHGSRPVFVAVFPDANKFYTVGRSVMDPADVVMNALDFAEDDKIVEPFEYSPRRKLLKEFWAKLGGIEGVSGTVNDANESPAEISLKQGLGNAALRKGE